MILRTKPTGDEPTTKRLKTSESKLAQTLCHTKRSAVFHCSAVTHWPTSIPTDADITVKMNIGLELPDMNEVIDGRTNVTDMPTKPVDPIAFLLTDGTKGIGVVIQDVTEDHDIQGPYYAIQADIGPTALSNVNTNIGQQLTRTSAKNNPDEFRITLKPSEYWGEAYSAIDGGHKSLFYFNKMVNLQNGLNLHICRVLRY